MAFTLTLTAQQHGAPQPPPPAAPVPARPPVANGNPNFGEFILPDGRIFRITIVDQGNQHVYTRDEWIAIADQTKTLIADQLPKKGFLTGSLTLTGNHEFKFKTTKGDKTIAFTKDLNPLIAILKPLAPPPQQPAPAPQAAPNVQKADESDEEDTLVANSLHHRRKQTNVQDPQN